MNIQQTGAVLAKAAGYDNRTIGQASVLAWHEALGDLDLEDCLQAVARHHRESTEYLMPAHIRRLVRLIRDERRTHSVVAELPPGKLEEDPDREERIARNRAKVHAVIRKIAERRSVPDAPIAELSPSEQIRLKALQRARDERTREAS